MRGPRRLAAASWRLHILASPDTRLAGTVVQLPAGPSHLGRGPKAGAFDLSVDDPALSRLHAAFVATHQDTCSVRDCDSRNGTYVNGNRIAVAEATTGAVIRVGDTVIVLERDAQDNLGYDEATAAVPGQSTSARAIRAALAAAARDNLPVLVCGETGSGKELAAAEVHRLSRRKGPLVRVNVTALPDALFESELFGHVRGAFTGAVVTSAGRFRQADSGTLVLDEIGDLSLNLQPKLLRVIEDGMVRPIGGPSDVPVDVKLVVSTNVNLEGAFADGKFRQDLLARLRTHEVRMQPLRDRRADWVALADAVQLPRWQCDSWRDVLDADAIEMLVLSDWRDNLRELRTLLARLLVQGSGPPFAVSDLPEGPWLSALSRALVESLPRAKPSVAASQASEKRHVLSQSPSRTELMELLQRHLGSVAEVAAALGRDRRQIYRWLTACGIDDEELRRLRAESAPAA